MLERPQPREWLFYGLWLFIAAVSAVDGYLVFRHRGLILSVELNPLGRKLIEWNGGHVGLLLAAKFAGTVVVCAALLLVHRQSAPWGLGLALALAFFQACLMVFLTVG
jgi:hypothetical protein